MSNCFRHLDTLEIWILDKCWLPFQSIRVPTSRFILVFKNDTRENILYSPSKYCKLIDASSPKIQTLSLQHGKKIQAVKIQRSQQLSRQTRRFRFPTEIAATFWKQYLRSMGLRANCIRHPKHYRRQTMFLQKTITLTITVQKNQVSKMLYLDNWMKTQWDSLRW